jgi:hypothetical protein
MSSKTFSSTSFSYSSSSSSFNNGESRGTTYQSTSHSDPSGTRVQTMSQNLGELPVQETRYYDSEGNQVLEDGRTLGDAKPVGRIEAVEDVDENAK